MNPKVLVLARSFDETIGSVVVAQLSRSWLRTRKARNHAIAELLNKSLSTVHEYPDDLITKVDSCIHRRSTQDKINKQSEIANMNEILDKLGFRSGIMVGLVDTSQHTKLHGS